MRFFEARWVRTSAAIAFIGASTFLPSAALATPTFPATIQGHLGLANAPDCSLCHVGPQQRGTVTSPFGSAMRARGLVAYDENALRTALDALDAEGRDSDADGARDIEELRTGGDPNAPAGAPGAGAAEVAPVPEYGCSAGGRSVHFDAIIISILLIFIINRVSAMHPRKSADTRDPQAPVAPSRSASMKRDA